MSRPLALEEARDELEVPALTAFSEGRAESWKG